MFEKIKTILCGFIGFMWITLVCTFLPAPRDIGGAEFNGFLSFLFWIVLFYMVIKKQVAFAGILSTVVILILRANKYGLENLSELGSAVGAAIGITVIIFALYKTIAKTGFKMDDSRRNYSSGNRRYQEDKEYDQGYDYSTSSKPELRSGSDEYWSYKEMAEGIYRDFCDAGSIDARRHYKAQGERLKRELIAKYGNDDGCVRSICDQFLDLRV